MTGNRRGNRDMPFGGVDADATQRLLATELLRIQQYVERHADGHSTGDHSAEHSESTPPTLSFLTSRFFLSPFERDVLMLCAGVELDYAFARSCAVAHGDPPATHATFSLALATLPNAHWSALSPQAPLRRWRLIRTHDRGPLVTSPLAIDERILHFLLGVDAVDTALAGMVRLEAPPDAVLPPSQMSAVAQLRGLLAGSGSSAGTGLVRLIGPRSVSLDVARRACADLGAAPLFTRLVDLPQMPAERADVARLLARECILRPAVVVVDGTGGSHDSIAWLTGECTGAVILLADKGVLTAERSAVIEVTHAPLAEQLTAWRSQLGERFDVGASDLERIAGQFTLAADGIADVLDDAEAAVRTGAPAAVAVWRACRLRSRHGLDALAQRIVPRAAWDDLILPEPQVGLLRDIARQVKYRATVYDRWGFAGKSGRGLGISALFTGESGTGKTMAAEVVAGELDLDLYRIDLAAVINKYIGETEKNLGRVFDAAADSGAVLLFDEADALFGKRSDVKDSHDRYANIELAYLLQRMEDYRGLAILTTNVKTLLDAAFLRRIRFVVQFPFPDAVRRAEIWQRTFPTTLPCSAIYIDRLARLNVSGGNIRNIAVNAAFLAAEGGEPLSMAHLLRAARVECAKLDKPVNEAELGGWL
jgi:hypothetical protein